MNLRTLRELRGLSRKELARKSGISFRSIQDYEQGHKDLTSAKADTVKRIAEALQCSVEALLSDKDLSELRPSELGLPSAAPAKEGEGAGEAASAPLEKQEPSTLPAAVSSGSVSSERMEGKESGMAAETGEILEGGDKQEKLSTALLPEKTAGMDAASAPLEKKKPLEPPDAAPSAFPAGTGELLEESRELSEDEKEQLMGRIEKSAKPFSLNGLGVFLAHPADFAGSLDAHPYTLMHKDREVANVLLEPFLGNIISVQWLFDKTLLPVGAGGNNAETASIGLKTWWQRRAVPITQGRIRRILASIGFETPQAYLLKNLGLSMEDCYWLKPSASDETWKDVSLFQNEFEDVVGSMHFGGMAPSFDFRNLDIRFPSASAQGDVPKAWVCLDDGKRLLVKGAQYGKKQQALNELLASFLHRKQGIFPYVEYQHYNIDYGNAAKPQFAVSAAAFTSEKLEFIPARALIQSVRAGGKTDYEKFLDACVAGGLKRSEVVQFLDYQILTDFVISNTDRSYENFGVLRDADTLHYVSLAPIFDCGDSMFYDLDMTRGTLVLKDIPVDSFSENEVGLLRLVHDREIVDLNRLPTEEELTQMLQQSSRTSEEIRLLITIYKRKKGLLAKFQRGDQRWMQ